MQPRTQQRAQPKKQEEGACTIEIEFENNRCCIEVHAKCQSLIVQNAFVAGYNYFIVSQACAGLGERL